MATSAQPKKKRLLYTARRFFEAVCECNEQRKNEEVKDEVLELRSCEESKRESECNEQRKNEEVKDEVLELRSQEA